MRSATEQIEAMGALWPGFTLVEASADGRTVAWEGQLAPFVRTHRVRVRYIRPLAIELFTLRRVQPRVQVLDPLLEWHPDYEEGPIPHVYRCESNPELPYLCLFSLEGREWGVEDLIAETTVPWAARWLLFYEGWLATKTWRGGGRHPGSDRLETEGGHGKRLASV